MTKPTIEEGDILVEIIQKVKSYFEKGISMAICQIIMQLLSHHRLKVTCLF